MPRMFRPLFLAIAAVIVLPVGTPSAQQSGSRPHLPKSKIPEDAKVILEHAEQFELLSLRHFYPPAPDRRPPVGSDFYDYEILGRTEIRDARTRENLVSAFEKGVAENNGDVALCFNPRHGIHVSGHGKKVDFVICFECLQVKVHGDVHGGFLVSSSPQPVFDKVLRDAGITLADK
jgi:hypothetical protein